MDPQDAAPASSAEPLSADTLLERATPDQVDKWRLSGDIADLGAPKADGGDAQTPNPPQTPIADSSSAKPDQPAAPTGAIPKADSEPADKTKQRIESLLTERARERERADRLERELAALKQQAPPAPAAKADAAPVATDDPRPDKTDATKYPDGIYDEKYIEDLSDWKVRQSWRARDAKAEEDARARHIEEQEHTLNRSFGQRVEAAKAKYPDFMERAILAPTDIVKDSPMDRWILESDDGADVLYYLQTTAGEARRIQALPIVQQLRELVRIGDKVTSPAAPARTISGAPAPAATLGGHASGGGDDVARALAQGDEAAYIAAANARDIAVRQPARRR